MIVPQEQQITGPEQNRIETARHSEYPIDPAEILWVEASPQFVKGGQQTVVGQEAAQLNALGSPVMGVVVRPMEEWAEVPIEQHVIDYIPGRTDQYAKEDQYAHAWHAARRTVEGIAAQVEKTGTRYIVLRGNHVDGTLPLFYAQYLLRQDPRFQDMPVVMIGKDHALVDEKLEGTPPEMLNGYRVHPRRELEMSLYPEVTRTGIMTVSSPLQREKLVQYGANPDRIVVIPPAINHSVFTEQGDPRYDDELLEKYTGIKPEDQFIVSPGRRVLMKGHGYVLEAFGQLAKDFPNMKMLVLGGETGRPEDDEVAAQLKARAAQLGVAERLFLQDNVPQLIVAAVYRAAARRGVATSCSWYENYCLMVPEGARCGAPVIAGATMGATHHAREFGHQSGKGDTVLMVNAKDPQEIALAVRRVFEQPGLRERMARNGIEWASQLSWEQGTRELMKVAQSLLTHEHARLSSRIHDMSNGWALEASR